MNASASAASAVAPLVAAHIRGRGVAAAGLRGHSHIAMGPEAAAPSARAAMAFAARANMPASLAVTAAAVNVSGSGAISAFTVESWPSVEGIRKEIK